MKQALKRRIDDAELEGSTAEMAHLKYPAAFRDLRARDDCEAFLKSSLGSRATEYMAAFKVLWVDRLPATATEEAARPSPRMREVCNVARSTLQDLARLATSLNKLRSLRDAERAAGRERLVRLAAFREVAAQMEGRSPPAQRRAHERIRDAVNKSEASGLPMGFVLLTDPEDRSIDAISLAVEELTGALAFDDQWIASKPPRRSRKKEPDDQSRRLAALAADARFSMVTAKVLAALACMATSKFPKTAGEASKACVTWEKWLTATRRRSPPPATEQELEELLQLLEGSRHRFNN